MKEKDLLSILALLQKIEPSSNTIKEIREEITRRIEREETSRFYTDQEPMLIRFFHTLFSGRFLPAFFVILLLLIGAGAMVSGGRTVSFINRVKIVFAANVYEKAILQFNLAKREMEAIRTKNTFMKEDAEKLAAVTVPLNSSMEGLNLVGERGKYTVEQCLELYKKYYNYLEDLGKMARGRKDMITQNDTAVIGQFLARMKEYEERAEERLGLYK